MTLATKAESDVVGWLAQLCWGVGVRASVGLCPAWSVCGNCLQHWVVAEAWVCVALALSGGSAFLQQ